ncbi:MAG: DUF2309 domain-containing protein [Myxococcales bacterium]|nr:DUF2309 domain-containing protein [Polyangiaceae bacterium]MDW8249647.1 DUF2309 domain-containing protein [Myxococcales bacterium]
MKSYEIPLDEVIQRACARISPSWPLDRFIAVNPFWELVESPLPEVAAKLHSLSGARLLMPRAWYRQAYREGRLRDEHLQAALEASGLPGSLASLLELLHQEEPATAVRSRVVDVVDAGRNLGHKPSWREWIAHSVSQFCAAYFDDGQATFGPSREGGLYASWRRHAMKDWSPVLLLGTMSYRDQVQKLPATSRDLFTVALEDLAVPASELENYLWGLLLDQNGWASWCAYRRWVARLEGDDDEAIRDLLAIRLAWEWMLLDLGGSQVARRWAAAKANWSQIDGAADAWKGDWILQTAMEIAWRVPTLRALPAGFGALPPKNVAVQAVFCIDVRSEVIRRALEAASPSVQTLGFAGFFGLPIDYQTLGTPMARPQLPGLLAPRLRAADTGVGLREEAQRVRFLELAVSWDEFKADPFSTFTFVESLGITYAVELLAESLGLKGSRDTDRIGLSHSSDKRRRPRLVSSVTGEPLGVEERCKLALGMLRGMSLTQGLARLVLLVGHGSSTRNNPHAAGLDCGACCGQTGEVNARVAAALLNDPEIRSGLACKGLTLPEHTWFLPALHDTTTDEIKLLELDLLPESHRTDVVELRSWLAEASLRARAERARLLKLEGRGPGELERAVRARSRDWAQVRPEWGLANHAAFFAAPRERCRHINFQGRAFLHEYRHEEDEGYATLELIMTAPMVVAHWINFQYYASTVDNVRYGSGNKVLHNVVGGHLGVFEGHGGDLRIGLPLQCLHDGERWVHNPLRLSVFIEAPREAIDIILSRHAKVKALVTHGWMSLFQIDEREQAIYTLLDGRWRRHRETLQ